MPLTINSPISLSLRLYFQPSPMVDAPLDSASSAWGANARSPHGTHQGLKSSILVRQEPSRQWRSANPVASGGLRRVLVMQGDHCTARACLGDSSEFNGPPITPAGVDLGSSYSSSLTRDHPSLQSEVVGSATGGGGLHSCLARATARALRRGFAKLVAYGCKPTDGSNSSPHACPLFCIQIEDVPVVPTTGGGLAAILSSAG
ncbi:hypothetical protein SCHPADRAFT_942987 [Schizopora paradoxa]|uniref:Uncharacterized protein n=1 Tax=Schizopora paradoxa TaxID=27342 RepID=A0A0H2RZL2_9AGAM|nr:hypothetical protein SCHPADRAFT_942987 [Schizopora paradoxa]